METIKKELENMALNSKDLGTNDYTPRRRNQDDKIAKIRKIKAGLIALKKVRDPQILREFIVSPILNGLVDGASSFGRGNNFRDFSLLRDDTPLNNELPCKMRFWGYRDNGRKVKKSFSFNMVNAKNALDNLNNQLPYEMRYRQYDQEKVCSTEMNDIKDDSFDEPIVGVQDNRTRELNKVSCKLKRLSMNRSKYIVEFEKGVQNIQDRLNEFGPRPEKSLEEFITDIVSSIASIAVFRGMVHQYKNEKNTLRNDDNDTEYTMHEDPVEIEQNLSFLANPVQISTITEPALTSLEKAMSSSQRSEEDQPDNDDDASTLQENSVEITPSQSSLDDKAFSVHEMMASLVSNIANNAYFRCCLREFRKTEITLDEEDGDPVMNVPPIGEFY